MTTTTLLKDDERDAQARDLGALHDDSWRAVKKGDARERLDASRKLIVKRWRRFFESQRM